MINPNIEPNFNLLLWILLFSFTIGAIARIFAGIIRLEKSTHYTYADTIAGLIELAIIIIVLIK